MHCREVISEGEGVRYRQIERLTGWEERGGGGDGEGRDGE